MDSVHTSSKFTVQEGNVDDCNVAAIVPLGPLAPCRSSCLCLQEQQEQFPLQKVLKVAATEREFGNYLFRQNRFCDAKVRYKRVRMLWELFQKTYLFNFYVDGCSLPTTGMPCDFEARREDLVPGN